MLSLAALDRFAPRHIGPSPDDIARMLTALNAPSLDALTDQCVPASIRLGRPLTLEAPLGEHALLAHLGALAAENQVFRSFIGAGYHDCITPGVILRNILENPGWYTQYTPYQAEIAQGRLEMLLNFQTLVTDLTGLPVTNASLLDEATAAAEAMALCLRVRPGSVEGQAFVVSPDCHPQTIAVVQGRAEALGVPVLVADPAAHDFKAHPAFGVLLQYPTTDGRVVDPRPAIERAHANGALAVVAADILALLLLEAPGALGADVAVGTTQRFGVPLGFGGPHAGYMATTDLFKRQIPGRVIGVSKDAQGRPAMRLALQTREQHIRRDKATSNICTAQVLLAVTAAAYACYHGPDGLRAIAHRVASLAATLRAGLVALGHDVTPGPIFDTLRVRPTQGDAAVLDAARAQRMNLRDFGDGSVGVALDETVTAGELQTLLGVFGGAHLDVAQLAASASLDLGGLARQTAALTHPVFHRYRSETEMLRYLARLQSRDLSLVQSMIPLGSCTMKLNSTTEMRPVTWPEFGRMHPFAPADQTKGYRRLFADLQRWLAEVTGFDAISLQPNAGSQGEYAGLLVIRAWHLSRGNAHRNVCLIPVSAHGTNPASAVMAGMEVVVVKCDALGNVDLADLEAQATRYSERLAALMITYPSTHGVFEEDVRRICEVVHAHGGQVYMDGANMNAQVGLCRPGDIGADVCHLNLHKTFCIPHGGGGPGMGPICVSEKLTPFLPLTERTGPGKNTGAISAAAFSSASILPIPWMYIRMMGADGLTDATKLAILNANYIAHRLEKHFPVLYRGSQGTVAHECIVDLRGFKLTTAEDVAKRLMDFGFHAPTLSWPVAGTLMIEPTESEPKAELDRFCDAMLAIHAEMVAVESGAMHATDNPLKNAPHTARAVTADDWTHAYTREQAAWPAAWLREFKFWPRVGRVDSVFGDRHLVCTCPSVEEFAAAK